VTQLVPNNLTEQFLMLFLWNNVHTLETFNLFAILKKCLW